MPKPLGRYSMLTFEEFKKILTVDELQKFSEFELEKLYQISTTFADFAYKSWINSRNKMNVEKC